MTPLPSWAAEYVGIPYAERGRDRRTGVDCWGLVWLVLTECASIDIQPFIVCPDDANEQEALIATQAQTGPWEQVNITRGRCYDVALMKTYVRDGGALRPVDAHVGVLLTPDRILHIEEGCDSVIVPFGSTEAIMRRIMPTEKGGRGLYRWIG